MTDQTDEDPAPTADGFADTAEAVITLALGTEVDVRCRFDQHWAHGFEIAEAAPGGYRLRRRSDGSVLPVEFPMADVRRRQDLGA